MNLRGEVIEGVGSCSWNLECIECVWMMYYDRASQGKFGY